MIKTKRNRKWKIPHTVLERRTLFFSSSKNRKLNAKLWWVGARERRIFLHRLFVQKEFFNVCFISMYSVLNKLSKIYILFHFKKHHPVHFGCLFLKLSKAFSVSLTSIHVSSVSILVPVINTLWLSPFSG